MTQQKKIIIAALVTLTLFLMVLISFSQTKLLNEPQTIKTTPTNKKINELTLNFEPMNNSGQTGRGELTSLPGGKTKISLAVASSTSSAQPVYIHKGYCDQPKEKTELLVDLKDGISDSIVNISLKELTSTPSSIIIRHSGYKLHTYNSCANILAP